MHGPGFGWLVGSLRPYPCMRKAANSIYLRRGDAWAAPNRKSATAIPLVALRGALCSESVTAPIVGSRLRG
jgi:hypothetical protein